ncbi:SLBB domain-containing protein [Chitinilyticum piscinae]|uniref:SLBB domain-containing protein n=1 Tax=Chitinilyticum piscinae TaxID=2866724 RepID=A0A8J7K8I2_9NEIS|nr:SLBB domain-containing protein [Chitinilyticum piscinae]MBE9609553.1 SLBB domain-containing protein [Chitinilyticum piscinae]
MPERLLLILAVLALTGCISTHSVMPQQTEVFQPAQKSEQIDYASAQLLAELDAGDSFVYRLAEGDQLQITVWNRPELSGKQQLGPDGQLSLPLAGTLKLAGETRESAAGMVSQALSPFYKKPAVFIGIEQYAGNRVTVLGRVQNPGVQQFDRPPTLLETLARAGSLPVIDKQATLTRVAIFRGRDRIIWVDLKKLLNRGELVNNIRLKANDLVYIPDSFDTLVYVLGAVHKPGAYRLTPDMSLLDALSQAGGPNDDAAPEQIALYRPGKQAADATPLTTLLTREKMVNYALEEGDVVFVPKSGVAEAGYVIRQLVPGLSILTLGLSAF